MWFKKKRGVDDRVEERRKREEGRGREGVLPCSKVKLVMSAMTHSSQHALLTSRTSSSSSLLSVALSPPLLKTHSSFSLLRFRNVLGFFFLFFAQ